MKRCSHGFQLQRAFPSTLCLINAEGKKLPPYLSRLGWRWVTETIKLCTDGCDGDMNACKYHRRMQSQSGSVWSTEWQTNTCQVGKKQDKLVRSARREQVVTMTASIIPSVPRILTLKQMTKRKVDGVILTPMIGTPSSKIELRIRSSENQVWLAAGLMCSHRKEDRKTGSVNQVSWARTEMLTLDLTHSPQRCSQEKDPGSTREKTSKTKVPTRLQTTGLHASWVDSLEKNSDYTGRCLSYNTINELSIFLYHTKHLPCRTHKFGS
jgi:hypothetical protein